MKFPPTCVVSRRSVLAAFGLAGLSDSNWAGVNKCTLPDGKVTYQSTPCTSGSGASLNIADLSSVEPDFPASPPRTSGTELELAVPDAVRHRVREALSLLKARDFEAYSVVIGYIGRVESGERTAMRANANPPTMILNVSEASSQSVTSLAAAFAHESYHSKMYYDYLGAHPNRPVPRQAYGGTNAEIKCERYALGVMRRIGAPSREIDWAKAHSDGNHVNDWDFQGDTRPPRR